MSKVLNSNVFLLAQMNTESTYCNKIKMEHFFPFQFTQMTKFDKVLIVNKLIDMSCQRLLQSGFWSG